MRRFLLLLALAGVAFAVFQACSEKHDPYTDDNPTSGHILILADEDLRSIVEAEEMVFESIYEKAQIDIRYLPEAQLLKAMLNDSVRCTISTVLPGGEQEAYLNKRRVVARPVPICTDGIAVVVNKERSVQKVRRVDLRSILFHGSSQGLNWRSLEGDGPADDPVEAVCVSSGSGVLRAAFDTLIGDREYGQIHATSAPSVEELIALVEKNKAYMGLISYASIGDLDDPQVKALRDRVRVVPLSPMDSVGDDQMADPFPAYLPSQSTLADGTYPLRRTVYMILTEGKTGLGTGFVSFVANHKGQRIILKKGLAPQKVPSRDVEIVTP